MLMDKKLPLINWHAIANPFMPISIEVRIYILFY